MANGHYTQALECFTQAREEAESLKMWPDVAHCHSLSADAIEKTVQDNQMVDHKKRSLQHRKMAQQLYSKMGMK